MKTKTITVTRACEIQVPMIPNFVAVNGKYTALCELETELLQHIGETWTKNLIARAEEQKTQKVFEELGKC